MIAGNVFPSLAETGTFGTENIAYVSEKEDFEAAVAWQVTADPRPFGKDIYADRNSKKMEMV